MIIEQESLKLAKRIAAKLNRYTGIEFDDLYGWALLSLVEGRYSIKNSVIDSVRKCVWDYRRGPRPEHTSLTSLAPMEATQEKQVLRRELWDAVELLSTRKQVILRRNVLGGEPLNLIADELGLSEITVAAHKHQAIKELQVLLGVRKKKTL